MTTEDQWFSSENVLPLAKAPRERPRWYWGLRTAKHFIENAQAALLGQEPVKAYRDITEALKELTFVWPEITALMIPEKNLEPKAGAE